MPTWINHFRIADRLFDKITLLDKEYFVIGTIAPDCGIPDEKHGIYVPFTGITHFTSELEYSKKTDCNYELVYHKFIENETDIKKRSFYIAYFIHLITDCVFAQNVFAPIENTLGDFRTNNKLRNQIKEERNNTDFFYLKNNISPSYELFKQCKPWSEDYPEWYQNNEIARQMKNIVRYYNNPNVKSIKYEYITPELMDEFVELTYKIVLEELSKRNIEL